MAAFKKPGKAETGHTALVVGGSGGIGRQISLAFARAGFDLIIHGHTGEKLARLSTELYPVIPRTIQADLSEAIIPTALEAAARQSSILVLAYGPFAYSPLAQTSAADWRTLALANLALPGSLVSLAAPLMAARGYGRIILFGGTKTEQPRGVRRNAAYAAAKTGLGVLARSVAAEYADRNVACVVLCPGMVDTEYLDASQRKAFSGLAPGGRLTASERIGAFVAGLVCGDMALINGSTINIDDGLHLGA
jgi:3-oxoacyl-[acyl-carrier protein] reductase